MIFLFVYEISSVIINFRYKPRHQSCESWIMPIKILWLWKLRLWALTNNFGKFQLKFSRKKEVICTDEKNSKSFHYHQLTFIKRMHQSSNHLRECYYYLLKEIKITWKGSLARPFNSNQWKQTNILPSFFG